MDSDGLLKNKKFRYGRVGYVDGSVLNLWNE
jgi:hypothetical protein